ncbi:MAG: DUF2298 domain-containing protein, partial [Deltaproteobacteria bacterium]|nr:DUF2298 domain-containing protein [Deltaproteobacteria bacterium]
DVYKRQILVSCYFIGFLSLGFTFKPIGGDPLRLINPLTHGLKLDEFFAHFGLHIIFLVAVTLINYTKIPKNFLACLCLLLGLSIGFNSSFLFLIFLICVSFAQKTSTTALFLLLVTFLTLLVPEILYLDDPYGGDAERLNTIFKTYYPSYISFSLACAHLFIHSPLPIRTLFSITYLLFTLTGLVFNLSSRPLTGHDFYAEIKKEIPDALPCIKMKMVRGVVLESEKEPYSWDSFFCTLSENICYLGWSNHIGLLYRNYGEIERRKSVMSRIYEGEQSCNDLSNLINTERIDYVFVGPKEKERYNINYQKFENCLKKICATKNASLYSVR